MKKKQSDKKKKYHYNHTHIINGKETIYINKTKSLYGKRQDKRSCLFYDKNSCKCLNDHCSKVICETAANCTGYKRKEKQTEYKLSEYDENYIQLPNISSVHESDNRYIGLSKNIGTPVHIGYLKSDGKRRHKARCIYYDKVKKICNWIMDKCAGSSHCKRYKEK